MITSFTVKLGRAKQEGEHTVKKAPNPKPINFREADHELSILNVSAILS